MFHLGVVLAEVTCSEVGEVLSLLLPTTAVNVC